MGKKLVFRSLKKAIKGTCVHASYNYTQFCLFIINMTFTTKNLFKSCIQRAVKAADLQHEFHCIIWFWVYLFTVFIA